MTPGGSWYLPASGGVPGNLLLRFRLRASDFLGRQKVTKDRFKDPWSLKIPFPSNPAPCLPLNPALREPTRPAPACCRPWVGEKPAAPDDAAPCVGGHWGVGPCERRRGQAPALHVAVSPECPESEPLLTGAPRSSHPTCCGFAGACRVPGVSATGRPHGAAPTKDAATPRHP